MDVLCRGAKRAKRNVLNERAKRVKLELIFDYAQARVSNSSIALVMRSPSLASDATFSPN